MSTQIEGVLNAEPTSGGGLPVAFSCNALIGVWVLQFDKSLLPAVRILVGETVILDGEQINETNRYGGVFRVDAIQKKGA